MLLSERRCPSPTIEPSPIIAEGKNSNLRSSFNIKTTNIPYNQVALVFNISHQYHHNFIALENFYSHGPFASLPLHGGFQSAIVWTEATTVPNRQWEHTQPMITSVGYRFGNSRELVSNNADEFSSSTATE